MKFHDAANLFPLMDGEAFESLKGDISKRGQLESVKLHDGCIIDGRNRFRACKELGITPRTENAAVNGSVTGYVLSMNLHRRHLSADQRRMVAADSLPLFEAEAKSRQKQAGKDHGRGQKVPAKSPEAIKHREAREEAATFVGVSPRSVSDAKLVKEKAPDLAAKVRAGDMKVSQAKLEIKRREKRKTLATAAKEAPSSTDWTIHHGDCLELLATVGDARLIFADPPYNVGVDYGDGAKADSLPGDKYMSWAAQWIGLCREALTTDGSLWILIGDEYAAEYCIALKGAGFTIRAWVKWYETFGVNCVSNFNRTSRHLFYAVLDRKRFVFNSEAVTRPSDRQTKYGDKRAAEGGKIWDDVWSIPRLTGTCDERMPDFPTQLPLALLRPIIGCASNPGDLVADPFCGSATTGAASIEMGRRFVGVEKQKKFWTFGTQRLKGVRK